MEFWQADALAKVRTFVETSFSGQFELYDVHLKPENHTLVLEILIDAAEGIKIKDCELVSRAVEKFLDEADIIRRQFTLEVSSPGVERVLKRKVDYERSLGKLVRWTLKPVAEAPRETFRGRLQQFTQNLVVVQVDSKIRELSLEQIEEAQTVFEFPSKPKRGKRGR